VALELKQPSNVIQMSMGNYDAVYSRCAFRQLLIPRGSAAIALFF
jgi:hypothetical protein